MCDFSKTPAKTALTLALSHGRGNRKCLKALLPKEKGWDEGKLVAHRVLKPIPDIVIEVIITSGNLDKREIYRSHQVPEVWFWQRGNLVIYQLQAEQYQSIDRSQFFPELDPQQLLPYLNSADQYDAVSEFTNGVRQGNF